MPGIVDALYNTYIFPHKTAIVIVIIFIIFAIASYYAYSYYKPSSAFDDVANAVPDGGAGRTAEVMFFYADWCPHCTKAEPEWNAFKQQYNKSVVNGYTIVCTDYDMSTADEALNPNHNLVTEFGITGYPTVKMRYNGKIIDYDASVSQSSLGKFVNTIV